MAGSIYQTLLAQATGRFDGEVGLDEPDKAGLLAKMVHDEEVRTERPALLFGLGLVLFAALWHRGRGYDAWEGSPDPEAPEVFEPEGEESPA